MNSISKEVPSLELCRKLKSLGWKQEGLYWWNRSEPFKPEGEVDPLYVLERTEQSPRLKHDGPHSIFPYCDSGNFSFVAPTVVEMLEVLPEAIAQFRFNIWRCDQKDFRAHYVRNGKFLGSDDDVKIDKDLPNALAKMLIYLIEEGHIKMEVSDE